MEAPKWMVVKPGCGLEALLLMEVWALGPLSEQAPPGPS